MVPGLVLAAGRSSRMGRSKALLPCGPSGETFVQAIAAALCRGGLEEALIVGRPDDAALKAVVESLQLHARFVPNPRADEGQLSSLVAGLAVADRPGVGGVLVTPVDVPLVTLGTVSTLLAVFLSTHAPIVRATHGGRHGHPVIFGRALFDELRRADRRVGARVVMRAHEREIVNVEVPDPGVTIDVDTPADYERIFGARL